MQEIKSVDGEIETTGTVKSAKPVAKVASSEDIVAPMPGVIIDIKVKKGDVVSEGQVVAILEAMKMETEIFASSTGTVVEISIEKGAQVNLGDIIISLG